MEALHTALKEHVNDVAIHYDKHVNYGVKVEGTRLRNSLSAVKKSCDAMRKKVLELSKAPKEAPKEVPPALPPF